MNHCKLRGIGRGLTVAMPLALGLICSAATAQAEPPFGGNYAEFDLATTQPGGFSYPSMARLASGAFVVVVSDRSASTREQGASFRLYSAAGTPVGTFTFVNQTTFSLDETAVAASGNGFVVVYKERNENDYSEIRGQRYTAAGVRIGKEFKINTTNTGYVTQPKVTGLVDGGFVVVWKAGPRASNSGEIYAQRYSETGARVGGEFIVNTTRPKTQDSPAVASLSTGGFVVVWNSPGLGGYEDVYAQRFNANGVKLGPEMKISTLRDRQSAPVAAGLRGGAFAVAWNDNLAVKGRSFGGDGRPVGATFDVGSFNYGHSEPLGITALADGRFLVAYSKAGNDIYARLFRASGTPIGAEFRVNTTTTPVNAQTRDAAAVTTIGSNMFVAWDSNFGIRLRRLTFPAP